MPRLIVLNGPPAVGKSTLAQLYVDDHRLALNLDIDTVRTMLGQWQTQRDSGLLARVLVLAMVRVHLVAGHDVVIPQYVADMRFIEELEQVTRELGVGFDEVVLLDSRENMLRRFVERTEAAALPAHAWAWEMLQRSGGLSTIPELYDALLLALQDRPSATRIHCEAGRTRQAYEDLLDALGAPGSAPGDG